MQRRVLGFLSSCSLVAAVLLSQVTFLQRHAVQGANLISEERCGDYCSKEHVQGYVGPVDDNDQLRTALSQLAYKQEIIVSHHSKATLGYQVVNRWRKAGYHHMLLLLDKPVLCHALKGALATVGCGWYADMRPIHWMTMNDWVQKFTFYLTAARAVRLGYNVLAVDTDSAAFGDFYRIVKTPPFNQVNAFAMAESGICVNSGFEYYQNASKNGPTAFALFSHVFDTTRWWEISDPDIHGGQANSSDAVPLFKKLKLTRWWTCWDQAGLSDALHSTIIGRPWFFECFVGMHGLALGPKERDEWHARHIAVYNRIAPPKVRTPPYEMWEVAVPEELQTGRYVGGLENNEPSVLFTAKMHMPHAKGVWPEEFGGYPFEPTLGPQAQHVLSLFTDTGDPMWPDPEDPKQQAVAEAVPTERFAYFPKWLQNCFQCGNGGDSGWWSMQATGRLPAAVTHMHAGVPPGDFSKYVALATSMPGGWDWDLAAKASGAPGAASGIGKYLANKAYHHLPPLVAYAPGVLRAHATQLSYPHYAQAMRELVKVAMLLGRIVAYPWAPCEVPWLQKADPAHDPVDEGTHKIPWNDYLNISFMVVQSPPSGSLTTLNCLTAFLAKTPCVVGSLRPNSTAHEAPRGLLPFEFDHWLTKQPQEAQEAGPHNTLPLGKASPGNVTLRAGEPGAEAGNAPPIFDAVSAQEVEALRAAPGLSSQPVVWLTGLINVTGLRPEMTHKLESIVHKCCGLQDSPKMEGCMT